MSDLNTSIEYAQGLTDIPRPHEEAEHTSLCLVVDRCETGKEPLTAIIHFKNGKQVCVTGLFASEINRRLRMEAKDE